MITDTTPTSAATVARIETVQGWRQLAPGVHNRFVVTPDRLAGQLPFVLLVEDHIEPNTGYHPHPHRGLETVTFALNGRLRHGDSTGIEGVLNPGDIQWMTAGSGIMHGGEPEGTAVHALQLWMALPTHLRASKPGTREQQRAQATIQPVPGGVLGIYGRLPGSDRASAWSQWPLTIFDLAFAGAGSAELLIEADSHAFFYILAGEATVAGQMGKAGEIVWIERQGEDRTCPIETSAQTRIIGYCSPAFDEPIIAHGPFVMGTMAEIQKAYADLQAGRLVA